MDDDKREILDQISEEIENQEDAEEELDIQDKKKKERIDKERTKLLQSLENNEINNLITRVAYLLNKYPKTRLSDVTLQIKYWREFDGVDSDTLNIYKDYSHLKRLTSIARARAKITNEYGLFKDSQRVRDYRRSREESIKEAMLANEPGSPTISIFADESSKNDEYIVVGGWWILDSHTQQAFRHEVKVWKKQKVESGVRLPKEFHFTGSKKASVGYI
ncbi:hypothetical protein [Sporolactobacillus sp. KGMB 08714]|uniref:hypothetical protein n=1 Tax=Sporolactobacillus sp. KGMB 08714 TaxID=3064704 RepID=UPI002FBF16DE